MARSNKDDKQYSYVKFQSPVPPGVNKEPVYELKLESKDPRYKVDNISRIGDTVYLESGDLIQETPWDNVVIARPIQ